ncbi:MAG TPA: YetF domain-containing protein [Acidobacteriaceae bacterium]|nr:YetF domain-containing protein [Acidobacteriaceae bacterium]
MYTIIHAMLGYFFLLLIVRVLSRRPGGQLTLFEFVIVFLMGGIIILSTVGDDRSETNCTCAIITIAMMHQIVAWLKGRFPRFGAVVDGTPLVLLKDGEWQNEAMHGMRIDPEDVMAAARGVGLKSLTQIRYAVLERNGAISIIPQKK